MRNQEKISVEPQIGAACESRLAAMGLESPAKLVEAALAGHHDAGRCTENDVVTRPGYERWATTLRVLGDLYAPLGFSRARSSGLEVLRSPDESFDIAVVAGNHATGRATSMPATRIERGPLSKQAVDGNRRQLQFPSSIISPGVVEQLPGLGNAMPVTWFLLHFYDESAQELRLELSVPVEFKLKRKRDGSLVADRGEIVAFEPRLLLPTSSFVPEARTEIDQADDAIEVRVERK